MGRAAVRTAVTYYFAAAGIPYVGTVYPARTYISETDYEIHMNGLVAQNVVSAKGSSAVLVVNLPDSERERRTLTGRSFVNDTDVHAVALEVFFANSDGDPLAAQADHDTVMDAIVKAIRADGTFGGALWSAGEFEPWIRVEQNEPFTDDSGMIVLIPSVIRFSAWEWLAGAAGSV